MRCLSAILFVACTAAASGCVLAPAQSITRTQKSPGDNFYKLLLSGDEDRYEPGELYTVTLVGSRTHNRVQQFAGFRLSARPETNTGSEQDALTKVGQFQLFADTLTTFDEECVNTVTEADDLPKTEVQAMWRAPPAGSGCVLLQAMVLENPSRWYAEDGQLTLRVCEQRRKPSTECCACDDAKYQLVFEGLWSNTTHPKDFPTSLWLTHFSDVIGASHVNNFSFWGEGQIASDGFRSLAEWGSVRLMEQELRQQSKYLRTIVKAAGLWYPRVNQNTSGTFFVDRKRHLLSLAAMLGPSPDWVVGVNGLNLCKPDCTWEESLDIDLRPYDAGTDSGISYMSPNAETVPHEKMYRITPMYPEDPRAPFYSPGKADVDALARLYLRRVNLIPKGCDEEFLQELTVDVAENTEDTNRPECATTSWGSWSACSVPCGKGLRMRTREYRMPQKAAMLACDRQLVSKEMCVADIPECQGGEGVGPDSGDLETGAVEGVAEGVCATSEWSRWSECSVTCGIGVSTRRRHFIDRMGPKKCPLVSIDERQKCMQPQCAEGEEAADDGISTDPECPSTPWSSWSPCSASCGRGVRLRSRLLLAPPALQEHCAAKLELLQQRPCVEQDDCTFDMATAKRICMEEADPGPCRGVFNRWSFNAQKLMCVPFVYNGCRGNRNNFLTREECQTTCQIVIDAVTGGAGSNPGPTAQPTENKINEIRDQNRFSLLPTDTQLPFSFEQNQQNNQFSGSNQRVDCVITDWSDWTPCSVSCGIGYQERIRMIKASPQNGGNPCPRRLNRRRRCHAPACSGTFNSPN